MRVEDVEFLKIVDPGQSFAKGDSLKGSVRIAEIHREDGHITRQYYLDSVDEIFKAPVQINLPDGKG